MLTDLFAADAVLGELLLIAGSAVHFITLGQEALGADWLLALKADETLLMPDFMLVLHILRSYRETKTLLLLTTLTTQRFHVKNRCCDTCTRTWRNHFVAALAARRSVTVSTLPTHDLAIILGGKRLIGQGLVALGTAETALMPVAVLMGQLLDRKHCEYTQCKMPFKRIYFICRPP